MNIWFDLYWTFFCIGGLTFGGGYAMLPMLEREIVERHHWSTSEELLDYYAVGQCTPGIIAVNVATIIGYQQKGLRGAALSTFGVVSPSLIIILIIAGLLKNISQFEVVGHTFGGIRVAVCVLILAAVFKLMKTSIKDKLGAVLFAAAFLGMIFLDLSPIFVVLVSALVGYLAKMVFAKEGKNE